MKGTKVLLYKDKLTGHKESIVGVYSLKDPKEASWSVFPEMEDLKFGTCLKETLCSKESF